MSLYLDKTASDTIELLEARLQRIGYVITGHDSKSIVEDGRKSANGWLRDLEHGLSQLTAKSRVIQDLLKLHARYPDIFSNTEPYLDTLTIDTARKLSTILASASLFPQAASRLISVNDTPVPTAELSSELIDAGAGLAKLEMLQNEQSQEIAALRQRTAAVLQRWYSIDVLQTGEYWANLEDRVEVVERSIRQASAQKEEETL